MTECHDAPCLDADIDVVVVGGGEQLVILNNGVETGRGVSFGSVVFESYACIVLVS